MQCVGVVQLIEQDLYSVGPPFQSVGADQTPPLIRIGCVVKCLLTVLVCLVRYGSQNEHTPLRMQPIQTIPQATCLSKQVRPAQNLESSQIDMHKTRRFCQLQQYWRLDHAFSNIRNPPQHQKLVCSICTYPVIRADSCPLVVHANAASDRNKIRHNFWDHLSMRGVFAVKHNAMFRRNGLTCEET